MAGTALAIMLATGSAGVDLTSGAVLSTPNALARSGIAVLVTPTRSP